MSNINTKGFIVAAISIAVSVILVVGCLIPVITDSLGTERTVLYTNEGDWYYNKVTNDTDTTITFGTYDYNDGYSDYPQLKVTIDDNEPIETYYPEWVSERSMDVSALPIFIFKTNDGKYGIEGVVSGCGGMQDAEPEYMERTGGMMYYRFIQGNTEPTLEYAFADEMSPSFSVTLSNGQVSYNNLTFPSINGIYELYLSGQTSGDYTMSENNTTVIDSTEFYCFNWCGITSLETDPDIGDSMVTYTDVVGSVGRGTLSTIIQSANTTFYFADGSTGQVITLDTQPIPDENGTIVNAININSSNNESIGGMLRFIVPVEIAEGGETEISPVLRSMITIIPLIVVIGLIMGTVGYFLRKQ